MSQEQDTLSEQAPQSEAPPPSDEAQPAEQALPSDGGDTTREPTRPFTLAIDVGGTGLKASVLDAVGKMIADRVRVDTTYPLSPDDFVDAIAKLVQPLPRADRASMGFPGVVRNGRILTAPHFVTKKGPGTEVVPALLTAWTGFDASSHVGDRLSLPTRVLNDADLQGLAVIAGKGLELVVTLGTGVGTALFLDGALAPHLELAHHPFRKGDSYNDQLGEAAYEKIGVKRWRSRFALAVEVLYDLIHYDHIYIGGGNARHLQGHISGPVTIVDNVAGILGGIKLWDDQSVPNA
jgi:polyphosphate glucokinase